MKRPRITRAVLDGIAAACGFCKAGPVDGFTDEDDKNVERAQRWAWDMLEWMGSQKDARDADANDPDAARRDKLSSEMEQADLAVACLTCSHSPAAHDADGDAHGAHGGCCFMCGCERYEAPSG